MALGHSPRWVAQLRSILCHSLYLRSVVFLGNCFSLFYPSINELNEIAGLFFVIYLEEFGETRSKTAWVFWFIHETCWVWPLWRFPAIFLQVGSLCSSVYLMYGPLVAASLDKFGLFCHLWKSSAIGSSSFLQAVELSWWAQASLPALLMSSQV